MSNESIERQFAKMGARAKIREITRPSDPDYMLDVRRDKRGEFYDIGFKPDAECELQVINIDPDDRHMVVLFKDDSGNKERYLCGHDERSWFVAAVPGGANTVFEAKEALKPAAARESQDKKKVRKNKRNKRHNEGYLRQGEWFFISEPHLRVDEKLIIRNEPIRRGRGKAHMVEEIYRTGGTTVYVNREHPDGLSQAKYDELLARDPSQRNKNWRMMRSNAGVYGRGKVSHPDHATIELPGWHRIVPNTESNASWSTNMTFLD
jgi:hypothetical protein